MRSKDELETFFRGHSSYGAQAVGKAVATFKALCQHAEFGDTPATTHVGPAIEEPVSNAEHSKALAKGSQKAIAEGPSLHIDIQIHISPESIKEQIDHVFESMSKHLYNRAK